METPHNIIGRTRERRSHHAIFVTFDMDKVPERARELATSQLKLKFVSSVDHDAVEKCFADCPAWFKNALHSVTQVSPEKLKYILPTLAYYFISGPWRNQWVRFGYDPRKTIEAAKLQTLDYRLRDQGGAKQKVKAKRNYASYLLPYKAVNWSKPKTSIIDTDVFSAIGASDKGRKMAAGNPGEGKENPKDKHQFRPGVIPTSRQTFYQFKDLMVDAAQKIIESNLKKGDAIRCDEKNGWFEPGTDQRLREVLTEEISKQLAKEKGSEALSMPEAAEEADNDTSASDSSDSDRDEERFDILAKELM
jgi:general transcription factor 3C polypeptide 5 (transcription factor C subunit 1)